MKQSEVYYDGVVTINLGAVAENYRLLNDMTGENCEVAAVVKADAYGLGMRQVARTLADVGCNTYFVANLYEASALREYFGDDKRRKIVVLNGFRTGTEEAYIEKSLYPVFNSTDEIKSWSYSRKIPAVLHIDTGMNRLGVTEREFSELVDNKSLIEDKFDVETVISHFVSADEELDGDITALQYKKFMELASSFPKAKKSISNSAGFFRDAMYALDMIRPGIALYGGAYNMNTVVEVKAKILKIIHVKAGETIGYGATHRFKEDRVTATVGIGYADGYLRYLSNKGHMYVNGVACPIVGRLSMDLTTIDITNAGNPFPKVGDYVEVMGENQRIERVAKDAGTISYEMLTGLRNNRFKRVYVS